MANAISPEEYIRLLAHCPSHIKPMVKVAYHTGMRQGEILNLTWGQVDVKEGFIKLEAWNTKTNTPRLVPLTRELVDLFKAMPRGFPAVKVFTYAGRQIGAIKTAFIAFAKSSFLLSPLPPAGGISANLMAVSHQFVYKIRFLSF